MRIPIPMAHPHLGQIFDQEFLECFGTGVYYDASGSICCGIDALAGLCTPALEAATGAALSLAPPAPAASVSAMTNYNPDVQTGQIQGAASAQTAANQAAAATAAGNASGAGAPAAVPSGCSGLACVNTSTWVLLAVAGTLAIILTVKS
jgi:hypothetical protein